MQTTVSASGLNVKLNKQPRAGCVREGQEMYKIIAVSGRGVGSTRHLEEKMWVEELYTMN